MLVALREGENASGAAVSGEPGLADLDRLVALARAGELDVTVTRSGERELPRALDQTAYRIVQEALTNAVRHGAGGPASVEVWRDDGNLEIRVRNPVRNSTGNWKAGFGVRGMHERATLLDGRLTAGPASDGQWRVEAHLPIAPRSGL